MKELTIGIATCGRPKILRRCIRSINAFTDIPYNLIILDNSKAFTDNKDAYINNVPSNAKLIEIEDKKIGCCESNNIIADNCDTQYLMHMDDDVYLKEKGIIESMLDKCKKEEDPYIIGGTWFDTFYNSHRHQSMIYLLARAENKKYIKKLPVPYQFTNQFNLECINTDECLHSMIMDKNKVYSKVRWDDKFKWKGDRLDFFLQCNKQNIKLETYCKQQFIHDPKPFKYGSLSYEDFNGKEAKDYFYKKWNIYPLVNWDKKQIKPGNV